MESNNCGYLNKMNFNIILFKFKKHTLFEIHRSSVQLEISFDLLSITFHIPYRIEFD